jgi:outer membrane receptor protein involved in Fe transport
VGGPYNGNSLPYAPQHSFNTNVDVEAKFGLGGQLAFAYVGPQFSDAEQTVAVDATGRVGRIEGRKWIDATVHYKHAASGLSGRITVKNALDEIVVLARRPEGIFPGGYRQIIAGIRWDFDR